MSKLTVEFPDSLRRMLEAFVAQEGFTVDQFLASAAAEKMAAMRSVEYLRNEAAQGNRAAFEHYLAAVPSTPHAETDALPD